jgi:hypothetical protein
MCDVMISDVTLALYAFEGGLRAGSRDTTLQKRECVLYASRQKRALSFHGTNLQGIAALSPLCKLQ